jgi:hypothetical protein
MIPTSAKNKAPPERTLDERDAGGRMSVPGQSRHFDCALRTSALPRSADIADQVRQVRKVPILLQKSAAKDGSFGHFARTTGFEPPALTLSTQL